MSVVSELKHGPWAKIMMSGHKEQINRLDSLSLYSQDTLMYYKTVVLTKKFYICRILYCAFRILERPSSYILIFNKRTSILSKILSCFLQSLYYWDIWTFFLTLGWFLLDKMNSASLDKKKSSLTFHYFLNLFD